MLQIWRKEPDRLRSRPVRQSAAIATAINPTIIILRRLPVQQSGPPCVVARGIAHRPSGARTATTKMQHSMTWRKSHKKNSNCHGRRPCELIRLNLRRKLWMRYRLVPVPLCLYGFSDGQADPGGHRHRERTPEGYANGGFNDFGAARPGANRAQDRQVQQ